MPAPTQSGTSVDLREKAVVAGLAACELFRGLSEADLSEIARSVRTKTLRKGEYLFREGEPVAGFYVVRRGAVSVHRVDPSGKEQVIYVFRAGESLAEAALSSPTGYPASARAEEESMVLMVPKVDFLAVVERRPDLAMRTLGSMGQHLRVLVERLHDLKMKSVEARVAGWLVQRCPQPPQPEAARIPIGVTKRVLAAELGITAETLSRTLASLRTRGLIAGRGDTLLVPRPSELAAFVRRETGESGTR